MVVKLLQRLLRDFSRPDYNALDIIGCMIAIRVAQLVCSDTSWSALTTWTGWAGVGVLLIVLLPFLVLSVLGVHKHWVLKSSEQWSDDWDAAYALGKRLGERGPRS